jgi:hypothetical protein
MEFGTLRTVKIRDLWPHEEHDFTPWLCEHIETLSEVLGLDLELIGREVDVGGFFLDVLARETGSGRYVVIENQFGVSNHDHLGKLLTYAGGKQAGVLVWIAESIREEHRQALEWLNEHADEQTLVFGLELTAFQIDGSRPVFQFKPVVLPNNWAKESRSTRAVPEAEVSDTQLRYQSFFQVLLDELREQHGFTNARKGQAQSWYSFASRYRGVKYGAYFAKDRGLVAEIYLDSGDKELNKKRFDQLELHKEELHEAFGAQLDWQRLDHRQASRICVRVVGNIADDDERLTELRQWLVEQLLKLQKLWDGSMKQIINCAESADAS